MNWLDPYWIRLRLIYIFLAVPIAFSVVVLVAGFAKARDGANKVYTRVNGKLITNQAQNSGENSMLIRCAKCGKVFNKPRAHA
jgi:hypothetical protein